MANRLKISSLVQNAWAGTGTKPRATQKLPAYAVDLEGKESLSVTFTGTSSHALNNDAGSLFGDAGSITYYTPFGVPITMEADGGTGAATIIGFAIHVDRAAAGTAPTGHVRFTNTGFCGWSSSSYMTLKEDSYFLFHNLGGATTADASTVTINMANGTGYRVNFIVWYEPA